MNTILFVDNICNNINIIINYCYKFLALEIPEKKEKIFSLLDLLLKMYKDKIYDEIIKDILEQLKMYIKENKDNGEDKMVIEDDDDLNSTNDSSFSQDEKESKDEHDPIRYLVEQIGNCVLDMELNPQNANGINYSGINIGKIYEKYEEILEEIMKENLNNLKEEEALETFEKMKTLLETDKNPRCLISKNIKIINRTKKRLTAKFNEFFKEYARNKYNISNKNYSFNSQSENFDDFSEESEKEIKDKIKNEINNIKKDLIEKEMKSKGLPNDQIPKDLEKMVNNYVDNNGDDMITLAKEAIFFQFREEQFFMENDQKIKKMLKGTQTLSYI